jgi:N-acetylmuramoyl-L-alanine amidase
MHSTRGRGFRIVTLGKPRGVGQPGSYDLISACLLILASAVFLSGAPAEKHLSVYSVAANYSLPLVERAGQNYVGLLELLEPLGSVSARTEGAHWRLRYNNVEGIFQTGKNRAQVLGRDADLGGAFLMENNRGLVPVGSLASLLPRFLGGPATLHEDSGRLFIGNVSTHFTASLASDNPPRLVLHFTAPVNPSVATEPGAVRLTFSREPVVSPASPTLTFGSKSIPSANYSERNGAAVLVINSAIPLMATFSGDGRTITIAPPFTVAQTLPPPAAPSIPTPAQPAQPGTAPAPAPAAPAPAPRRYFAVVDASHGGDDHGETLSSTLLEKDVTVAFARSLRQELESRGISTLVLRDSDANLSLDQRAVLANADRPAIYIAVHASSSSRGVRVYSALLPYGQDDRGPFLSWATAQQGSLPVSQNAANAVAGELEKRQVPVRALAAPLRPLNNVVGPAIAVEVGPQGSDVAQLTAPDYQQLITGAVASGVAAVRDQLGGAQPRLVE